MVDLYDRELWLGVFHIYMALLLIYSLLHKIWEYSKTTLIVIIGFEVFGVMIQFLPIAIPIVFLILLMTLLYYRAMIKPRKRWSKYETTHA